MPLERDDQEERLARIDQILRALQREVHEFGEIHQRAETAARQTREQARRELEALRAASRPVTSKPTRKKRRKKKS